MYKKTKLSNLIVVISSLFGYLEWGEENNSFLFQIEWELIGKFISEFGSVIHPFTIIPMLGQLLVLITVFQTKPSKTLTFLGIGCLGLLLIFLGIIGIISLNPRIFFSVVPFIVFSFFSIRSFKKDPVHL